MDPMAIYEDLKNKIIWLELKPGSTLNQVELAEHYGVSRNPITIALTRLDAEEWVIRNGSHLVISPLTLDRMRDITEIRALLEVQANIWAMHRISTEGLKELDEIRREILELGDGTDNRRIVEMDVKLHRFLYSQTQNVYLADLLERLLSQYLRFWLSIPRPIHRESFFTDILDILQAIEEKDEVRLKAATTAHIRGSLDEIMGF